MKTETPGDTVSFLALETDVDLPKGEGPGDLCSFPESRAFVYIPEHKLSFLQGCGEKEQL